MTVQRILIVSGTHGNEINPVWAVKQFNRKENSLNNGIEYEFIIGNPAAYEKGCRYIDVDLNRSFKESENFDQHKNSFYETNRANFLVDEFGIDGSKPCQIAIDLHTTTANMGTSIVMYGRRSKDFCLAALLQKNKGDWIFGEELTYADIYLFPTLIRWELIYSKLFKCTEQELSSFEKIIEWRLKFFNLSNVNRTCFDNEWKKDYYKALFPLNPNQLIPVLPSLEEIMRLDS